MKVTSHSYIKFNEQSRLKFAAPVSYEAPSGISVKVRNHDKDDDTLVVDMNLEVADLDTATFQTERELLRLVNLLSWKHNLVITKYRPTGYQHSETVNQLHAVLFAATLHASGSVSMLKTIGAEGVKALGSILTKEYGDEIGGVLLAWRDAIGEESPMARMLLMFQILEGLSGSRKKADEWIRRTEPKAYARASGWISML